MTTFDLLHSTPTDSGRAVPGRDRGPRPPAPDGIKDDQHEPLRRLVSYRKACPGAAVACPAELLGGPGIEAEVAAYGLTVDVRCPDELVFAMSLGIPATRIVMYDDGRTAAPVRCGVNAGVGRIVMANSEQIKVLAGCVRRTQRVVVDATTECVDDTVGAVLACRRLDLVGMHATLTPASGLAEYVDTIAHMVAHMSWIRRHHGVILTRVSLAGGVVLSASTAQHGALRAFDSALDDAFDDACARFRFPRPALMVTPR